MRNIKISELTNRSLVRELYDKYYLSDVTPPELVSSHWKEHGAKLCVVMDDTDNITSLIGCGHGDSGRTNVVNRILKYICNFSYFIRLSNKKDLLYLSKKAIPVIKKMDTYFSYDCFRQICSLSVIREHFRVDPKSVFNIMVIGDGFGFLSGLLKKVYPRARITLVDIGKSTMFQAVNLQRAYPNCSHRLAGRAYPQGDDFDFLYVPTEQIYKIGSARYDLFISIASMQEMNYSTIARYFDLMRHACAKDSLFYCCNRVSKKLSGGELIEFLKYPWQKEDRYFVDEICGFYKYTFIARFPFIQRFNGLFMHRLVSLKRGEVSSDTKK
jgi:hypothetical protein